MKRTISEIALIFVLAAVILLPSATYAARPLAGPPGASRNEMIITPARAAKLFETPLFQVAGTSVKSALLSSGLQLLPGENGMWLNLRGHGDDSQSGTTIRGAIFAVQSNPEAGAPARVFPLLVATNGETAVPVLLDLSAARERGVVNMQLLGTAHAWAITFANGTGNIAAAAPFTPAQPQCGKRSQPQPDTWDDFTSCVDEKLADWALNNGVNPDEILAEAGCFYACASVAVDVLLECPECLPGCLLCFGWSGADILANCIVPCLSKITQ